MTTTMTVSASNRMNRARNIIFSMILNVIIVATLIIGQQQYMTMAFSVVPGHSRLKQLQNYYLFSSPTTTTTPRTTTRLGSTKEVKRQRSRVTDPAGPTPEVQEDEMEVIDLDSLPESHFNESDHLPNQPWRRGWTDGCEAPIDAPWRRQAEELIELAVEASGGKFIDVTWYLTTCVVTIDDKVLPERNLLKDSGPEIEPRHADEARPRYYDPSDPNPEDIWTEEDSERVFYESDNTNEQEIKKNKYAPADLEDGETDDDLGLNPRDEEPKPVIREYREDMMLREYLDRMKRYDESGHESVLDIPKVNTAALSTIAGAIISALEDVEDELRILERHEIVLSSMMGMGWFVDTQKEFDKYRGYKVAVHTQDPWESNRIIKGVLVDRNSMDVIINQQGRMVTIPNNFVSAVELKERRGGDNGEASVDEDYYEDEEEEEEDDDYDEEDEDEYDDDDDDE